MSYQIFHQNDFSTLIFRDRLHYMHSFSEYIYIHMYLEIGGRELYIETFNKVRRATIEKLRVKEKLIFV